MGVLLLYMGTERTRVCCLGNCGNVRDCMPYVQNSAKVAVDRHHIVGHGHLAILVVATVLTCDLHSNTLSVACGAVLMQAVWMLRCRTATTA